MEEMTACLNPLSSSILHWLPVDVQVMVCTVVFWTGLDCSDARTQSLEGLLANAWFGASVFSKISPMVPRLH